MVFNNNQNLQIGVKFRENDEQIFDTSNDIYEVFTELGTTSLKTVRSKRKS
jgi:hypothetical protein